MVNKDVDVRIKMIEGKPINGGAGTKAKTAKFDAPKAENAPKSLVGDSIKGGDLAPVEGQDVNKIYQEGLEAFNAGNTAKAEQNFNLILDRFSTDKLAANAQYWLGEVYYSQKIMPKRQLLSVKAMKSTKTEPKGRKAFISSACP